MTRNIIHVDMDAFYASVEQLDRPEWAGRPVIVAGAAAARGVVSSASYEARRCGVHSAMPTAQAVRLCPQAVVAPVRMARYAELSEHLRTILLRYTALVEPIALDEAFLDITDAGRWFGGAQAIGRAVKAAIKEEMSLTASVGGAGNKFLAKLGSDLEKPDGFVVIDESNRQAILDALPVGRLWGVGQATEQVLNRAGIETVAQLRLHSAAQLRPLLGSQAEGLLRLAAGIDDSPVVPEREAKSISAEHTFAHDVADDAVLLATVLEQVEQVGWRLRRAGLAARTVTLKLRYGDFRTLTRRRTLPEPTATTQQLWDAARALYATWRSRHFAPLRLIGMGVSGLSEPGKGQGALFPDEEQMRQQQVDAAVDAIRARFGKNAIRRQV